MERNEDEVALVSHFLDRAPLNASLRADVWSALLGRLAPETDAIDSAAVPVTALTLPNQRTVHVDAERTRQDLPDFANAVAVHRVETLLTAYCHRSGSRYKQGLNELLAVPMQLKSRSGETLSDGSTLNLLTRIVEHFAPRFFASDDVDFISLQCSFRLFRLLTIYHDPALSVVLDQYDVPPELYATPWFLTLFARNHNDTELVFTLWDFLFLCIRDPGPAIFHFVALAFLMSHRSVVLCTARDNVGVAELPMKLSRLVFTSIDHVREVCASALDLFAKTPRSFRVLLHNICYSGPRSIAGRGSPIAISPSLLLKFERRMCMKISVDEVLSGAASRLTRCTSSDGADPTPAGTDAASEGFRRLASAQALADSSPRCFLIDCRSREEFDFGGHLPTAFHFDPTLFEDPERLEERMSAFADLRGVHLAVMGPGDVTKWYHAPQLPKGSSSCQMDDDAEAVRSGLEPLNADEEDDYSGAEDCTRKVVLCFLQREFTFVSEVEGGYTAMHQRRAHFLDSELVGHNPKQCMVCSGGRALKEYAALRKAENSEDGGRDKRPVTSPASLRQLPLQGPPGSRATGAASSSGDVASGAQRWLRSIVSVPESSQHLQHARRPPQHHQQPSPRIDVTLDAQRGVKLAVPSSAAPGAAASASVLTFLGPPPPAATPPHPGAGSLSNAVSARSRARTRSSFAQGLPTQARPHLNHDLLFFDGYDRLGRPLLSEMALLDVQCDNMERESEASGLSIIPVKFQERVLAKRRKTARRKPPVKRSDNRVKAHGADDVVYIEDVIYSAAASTAKRAALAFNSVMSPPALGIVAKSTRAASGFAAGPALHFHSSAPDDVPTLSFADFMASGPQNAPSLDSSDAAPSTIPGKNEENRRTERSSGVSITRQFVASAAAALAAPPASLPTKTVVPQQQKGSAANSGLSAARRNPKDSVGGGLPAASQRSLERTSVAVSGPHHETTPALAASTTAVGISPANSRYLDNIRRAALAGLASMGPPRK
jgi:hypothetical protein